MLKFSDKYKFGQAHSVHNNRAVNLHNNYTLTKAKKVHYKWESPRFQSNSCRSLLKVKSLSEHN